MNKESIFYCPFDGILLQERSMGFIYCKKCKRWFLSTETHVGRFILQEIYQENEE